MRTIHAEYKNSEIVIYDSYVHKETIKQIKGRVYNPEDKNWTIPFSMDNITILKMLGCSFGVELLKKEKESVVINGVRDTTVMSVEPMPIKVTPYAHQIEAFNRACTEMKLFKGGNVHG